MRRQKRQVRSEHPTSTIDHTAPITSTAVAPRDGPRRRVVEERKMEEGLLLHVEDLASRSATHLRGASQKSIVVQVDRLWRYAGDATFSYEDQDVTVPTPSSPGREQWQQ